MSSVCGIDLGSRNVKLVIKGADRQVTKVLYDTVKFYREYGYHNRQGYVIDRERLNLPTNALIVATGYGRNALRLVGAEIISEMKAHTLGAIHQTGKRDFILLDIGGQDIKVVEVVEGEITGFVTNDRCAAGSGRYLENMASALGITLAKLADAYNPTIPPLSTICAIYSESEVISRLAEGETVEQVAAAVNRTVADRVLPLLARFEPKLVVMAGGTSYNGALQKLISELGNYEVAVLPDPLFNAALGCVFHPIATTPSKEK